MIDFWRIALIVLDVASAIYLFLVLIHMLTSWSRKPEEENELLDQLCLPKNAAVYVVLFLVAMTVLFLTIEFRDVIW